VKAIFRVATILFVVGYSVQTHASYGELEYLKEKLVRLEGEIKAKTGDDKLAAYRELLDRNFYVPDKTRHQHIQ